MPSLISLLPIFLPPSSFQGKSSGSAPTHFHRVRFLEWQPDGIRCMARYLPSFVPSRAFLCSFLPYCGAFLPSFLPPPSFSFPSSSFVPSLGQLLGSRLCSRQWRYAWQCMHSCRHIIYIYIYNKYIKKIDTQIYISTYIYIYIYI
jgi:hypothetical protein